MAWLDFGTLPSRMRGKRTESLVSSILLLIRKTRVALRVVAEEARRGRLAYGGEGGAAQGRSLLQDLRTLNCVTSLPRPEPEK